MPRASHMRLNTLLLSCVCVCVCLHALSGQRVSAIKTRNYEIRVYVTGHDKRDCLSIFIARG